MTSSQKKAEVVLGCDNYFLWEFVMRMTLARKGLLAHVEMVKDPATMTEAWLLNDMKVLGLIAQGVSVEHYTKIRSATSAMQAWNTLLKYYNRTTIHNRVTMTRRLHEFKKEDGSTMARHLDKFDGLIVGLQTLGEPLGDSRQLIILLSSLPAEYELIVSIVENIKDVTLIEAREKLLKEYERQEKQESSEHALKPTSFGGKGKNGKFGKVGKRYAGKGNGSRRLDRGMSVEFQRNSCIIWNESKAIASGKKYVDSEWELWYARMGYLNEDSLEKIRQVTTGMPKTRPTVKTLCGGCMKGKQTVTHFPSQSRPTTPRPLELVHTVVMGPMKTKSKGGARYVLVFVDDYSRYVVTYFLNKKSEVANTFKLFLTMYENQWGERIKCLRSDNGIEFVNKTWTRFASNTASYIRRPPEAKSFKCMFLGYAEDSKGYRVYDLESNKVKVSRSVKLDEREVNGIYDTTTAEDSTIIYARKDVEGSALTERTEQPAAYELMDSVDEEEVEDVEMQVESDSSPGQELTTYRRVARPTMDENMSSSANNDDPENDDHFWPPSPKRPRFDEDSLLAEAVLAYAADIGNADDAPTTYQQAKQNNESSEWAEAMNIELKAHADNGSWTLGFKQKFGVDFFETYSPVANMNSIRVVLSVVVALEYVTEQLDADTAFLNSELKERVYMEVPYCITNDKNMMCRLDKAIYGLKQAASVWHKTIH
ncbi:reverse transcriptase [Phytophthora megakarya]|uniref:Reverse transcriptase n=1 Tax=Phytophthora megakarya TaxID=4795 RepID=A0A225WL34_9STRA|nr:reverse transcriptase [Phytophthora megakarya]